MAWHGMVQPSRSWHSMAWHGTAWPWCQLPMAHTAGAGGSRGPAAMPTPRAVPPLDPAAARSGLSSSGLVTPGVCAGSAAAGHGSGLNPSPPAVKTPRKSGRAPLITARGVCGAEPSLRKSGHRQTQAETPRSILAGAGSGWRTQAWSCRNNTRLLPVPPYPWGAAVPSRINSWEVAHRGE